MGLKQREKQYTTCSDIFHRYPSPESAIFTSFTGILQVQQQKLSIGSCLSLSTRGSATAIESGTLIHMILRPKFSSPPRRLFPTPRTPQTLSLSQSIVNCGDSKDVQNSSNDSSNDAKCHQNHPGDNVFDSMCLQYFSIYSGGHLKLVEDEMCGSHGKEKQSFESSRFHEMNLTQDKTPKVLQVIKYILLLIYMIIHDLDIINIIQMPFTD